MKTLKIAGFSMDLIFFSIFYAFVAVSFCRFVFNADIQPLSVMYLLLLPCGAVYFVICGYSSIYKVFLALILICLNGGAYMIGGLYEKTYVALSLKSANWLFVAMSLISLILMFSQGGGAKIPPFQAIGIWWYYIFCALTVFLLGAHVILAIIASRK